MIDEDDAIIGRFNLIADFINLSKDARVELVRIVKEVSGDKTINRKSTFEKLIPFLQDFGKDGWGPEDEPHYKMGYIYSSIKNGRVKWPIAPMIAWLSVNNREKFDRFLICYRLIEKEKIENCNFTLKPGSIFERRKNLGKVDSSVRDIESPRSQNTPVRRSERLKAKKGTVSVHPSSSNDDAASLEALAKIIVRNRRHIRQLLNVVVDIASVSNIPGHDVEKTLRKILTRRGSSRKEQAYNHTYLPGRRPKPVSRHAAQPFDAVKDISGALLWLRSADPAKLASYYETIGAMRTPSGRIKLSRLM